MALYNDPIYKGTYEALAALLTNPPAPEGGGWGTGRTGGPGSTMGSGQLPGGVATGMRGAAVANTLAGLAGFGVPGLNMGLAAMLGSSALLGGPYEADLMYGTPTRAQIQGIRDIYGEIAAKEAEAELANTERAMAFAESPLGRSPAIDLGLQSVGSPGGGPTGESPNTEAGGPTGSSTSGPSTGGTGGGENTWAGGGVSRAMRGPRRATFGEAGPEQAIFIPQAMRRPGIQGREVQVRRALQEALRALYA